MKIWVPGVLAIVVASQVWAQPSIRANDGIANANGYQTTLAPGVTFVIFGSGLGPASIVIAPATDYQTSLAGTSVSFTPVSGGAPIDAKIVYTLDTQLAGLLPSSAQPGTYAVRVTYNGTTSPPQNVTVIERSFGIATANSGGNGPAQATIGNVNGGISLVRFTSGQTSFGGYTWSLTPAHPGDTLVLWGTGGGADPANDAGGSSGDQTAAGNFKVLVGAREITPFYAGTSPGTLGLWQINFVLPADVEPNCFTQLSVSAGGQMSNTASIAISPAGQNACSSSEIPASALAKLDAGGTIVTGGFTVGKTHLVFTTSVPGFPLIVNTSDTETIAGAIGRYTAAAIGELYGGLKVDGCTIYQKTALTSRIGIGIPSSDLDAGATLPVTGPGLAAGSVLKRDDTNGYGLLLNAGTVSAGTYQLTGSGGADVGAFNASVDVPGSFTPTNLDSITNIDRSQPLSLTWSGGGSGMVDAEIIGATTVSGSYMDDATWVIKHTVITCEVPASQGTLTVTPNVLSYLSPASLDITTGTYAYLGLTATSDHTKNLFTAPLTAGGQTDDLIFTYSIGGNENLTIQ